MCNKVWAFACFLLVIFSGCDNQRADRTGFKEEKARRELKKVSEAEILNEATKIGQDIATEAEKLLEKKSDDFLEDHVTVPIRKANINWIHGTDSLENHYEVEINYLSLITSKEPESISPIEAELMDAYQYNIEKNISLSENIQKIESNHLLYNRPIILTSSSCLRCHGTPGEEVAELTLSSLKEVFPSSKVHGYSLGSVMGFWSIRLSQKKIVQEL